jgi:hypothetical protein
MNTQPTPISDRIVSQFRKGEATSDGLILTMVELELKIAAICRERDEARAEMIRWQSIAEGRGRTDDEDIGKAMSNLIRQRDEARKNSENAKAYKRVLKVTNAVLKRERNEARFDLDFRRRLGDLQNKMIDDLTAQRDRLAEALQTITITGSAQYCREIADEALQSLTPDTKP